LRNPSDKPQNITIDLIKAFELPTGFAPPGSLHGPWKEDRASPGVDIAGSQSHVFSLQPFQVLVLEGAPLEPVEPAPVH